MKDLYLELIDDCNHTLGEVVTKELEEVFEKIFESDFDKDYEINDYIITHSFEKIHVLQRNVCVSIEKGDIYIELLFEDGINNGTELNDYSINPISSFTKEKRYYEEIVDLEVDIERTKMWAMMNGIEFSLEKANILLQNNKSEIMKKIKNQSYDNYVTGGGTNITDRYYENFYENLNNRGIFWTYKTKTIEVDNTFM